MIRKSAAALTAALTLFGFGSAATAQTIVTNGSFEADGATFTSPPTGWTRSADNNCGFSNRTGGSSGYPPATNGTYIGQIGFGSQNTVCQYYQDVAIPASSSATLAFAVGPLLAGRTGTLSISVVPSVGAPLVVYTALANTDVTLAEVTPIDISAYSGQTVRLRIDANSGNYFNAYVDNFRITAPVPTVTSVTPSGGSAAGGTVVTLTGTNFTSPGSSNIVRFGATYAAGTAATNVTYVSPTQLTVTAPAGTAGVTNIFVSNAIGTSDGVGAGDNFTYATPAPVPTMSEWAMILFSVMLAGGAALYVQRRQFG